jgi:hypothetical protein
MINYEKNLNNIVGTKIVDGRERTIKVWLEYVMRKGIFYHSLNCPHWIYKYKLLKSNGGDE